MDTPPRRRRAAAPVNPEQQPLKPTSSPPPKQDAPRRRAFEEAAPPQPPQEMQGRQPIPPQEPRSEKPRPPHSAPKPKKKKKRRSRKLIIALIVLLLLLIALVIAGVYLINRQREFERYQFDTDAMAGRIQMMTEEEIQAELNRVIEEGMFNISIASSIVFESPTGKGEARIENIHANNYHMQVDITLDETGEKVYSSSLIRPGYSIEHIRLSQPLDPGEYEATAVFSAITQEEMQLFGQAAAKIRLYVMDEEGRLPTPTPSPAATPAPTVAP